MTTIKFKQIAKDQLFYDRWQYSIKFSLREITALCSLNHEQIDSVIARRKMWRAQAAQRWNSITNLNWSTKAQAAVANMGIIRYDSTTISDETVQNLHTIADLLINTKSEFKLVTSMDLGWIYTNDLVFLEELAQNQLLTNKTYTEAVIDRPKDTIKLKTVNHRYRSYLKVGKVTEKQKENIGNFLRNQPDIRISPGILEWLNMPSFYLRDHYFIDHNDESFKVMLSLIKGGLFRKTVELISA